MASNKFRYFIVKIFRHQSVMKSASQRYIRIRIRWKCIMIFRHVYVASMTNKTKNSWKCQTSESREVNANRRRNLKWTNIY